MLIFGLAVFCRLVGCWVYASVKRDGGPSPAARGLGVTAALFVTPLPVFFVIGTSLTGGLLPVVGIVPVVLLGLGVYVFATGLYRRNCALFDSLLGQ